MKILTVVGARPQFIKAAAVSREIAKHPSVEEIIIHTGQHYDENMSEVFFREMEIPKPSINLGISGVSHGEMTGKMMIAMEPVFIENKPDLLIVYGDTNSTLAAALTASKLNIPIAHIEAGLRSFNMNMPEEINRVLTDRVSKFLFCPTTTSINNLVHEGYKNHDCEIIFSGDVMLDAALYYSLQAQKKSEILKKLNLSRYILCTVHRQENTDSVDKLKSLIDAVNELNKEIKVIFPIHPRTRKIMNANAIRCDALLIDPVGYFDMMELTRNCVLIMTDSGGLQKEAFFFKKCCVTLREQTEWTELTDNGFNILAGTDKNLIIKAVHELLNYHPDFNINLYGKGNSSATIVNKILS